MLNNESSHFHIPAFTLHRQHKLVKQNLFSPKMICIYAHVFQNPLHSRSTKHLQLNKNREHSCVAYKGGVILNASNYCT